MVGDVPSAPRIAIGTQKGRGNWENGANLQTLEPGGPSAVSWLREALSWSAAFCWAPIALTALAGAPGGIVTYRMSRAAD